MDLTMAKRKKQSTFERLTSGKLNRKQRKDLARRVWAEDPGLEVVHRNVAGIDVGNASHFVAVPPGRDAQPVREFGSWKAALLQMVEWLRSCGIEQVVMQSTGVYWIAPYDVLEQQGFRVCLTNARDTKNLPGRKSDVQESQWLMKLHTYGLLRNSFRPPEEIRRVRTVWRLRGRHVEDAAREIQHMQKALTTMNVQLANTISDLSGVSGQAIIRAILRGERDPRALAKLVDYRVKASEEEIARSLEGHWREDVLFELHQAVDRFDFCQRQLAESDQQLERYLSALPERTVTPAALPLTATPAAGAGREGGKNGKRSRKKGGAKPRKNQPTSFDLQRELTRICGVDLTTIDGVGVMTVQTFISELGTDMSRWSSEDHLVSWLKLSPNRSVTGGKVIKQKPKKTKNRAAEALRMAASTLKESDSFSGSPFPPVAGASRARVGYQSDGCASGTTLLPAANAGAGMGRSRRARVRAAAQRTREENPAPEGCRARLSPRTCCLSRIRTVIA
jgi:transposase